MATGSLVITYLIYNIISSLQTRNKSFLAITLAIEEAQCMDFEKLYYFLPIFFHKFLFIFLVHFLCSLNKEGLPLEKNSDFEEFYYFLPKKIS